jgi:hypothetical protein
LTLNQLIWSMDWYSNGAWIVNGTDWALVALAMRVFDRRISFAIGLPAHKRALVEDSPLGPERTFNLFLLSTLRCLVSPNSCVLTTDLSIFIKDYRVSLCIGRQGRRINPIVYFRAISHHTQVVCNLIKFISFV